MEFEDELTKKYNRIPIKKLPQNAEKKKSWPQTRWKPAVNLAKENKQT
jgi:hypothetical protein